MKQTPRFINSAVIEGVNELGTGTEIVEGLLAVWHLRFRFRSQSQFIHTFNHRACSKVCLRQPFRVLYSRACLCC